MNDFDIDNELFAGPENEIENPGPGKNRENGGGGFYGCLSSIFSRWRSGGLFYVMGQNYSEIWELGCASGDYLLKYLCGLCI